MTDIVEFNVTTAILIIINFLLLMIRIHVLEKKVNRLERWRDDGRQNG